MMKPSIYQNSKDGCLLIVQDSAPSQGNYNSSEGFWITKFFIEGHTFSAIWSKEYLLNHIETYSFKKMKLIKRNDNLI